MKYVKTFEQFINEKYSLEEGKSHEPVNEAKSIFIVQLNHYDGKYSKQGEAKYFSNLKKAKQWLTDNGYEPAKHQKFNYQNNSTINVQSYVKDYFDDAEIYQAVLEEMIFEKRYSSPSGGFKLKDIEKILKSSGDLELFANGHPYYINSYMHKNGKLDDATDASLFAIDQEAEEFEIKLKDIEFINA